MQDLQFLNLCFNGAKGFVEFRLIGKEGTKDRRFIDVEDLNEDLLQRLIDRGLENKLNVYFSVATRNRHEGTEKFVQDVPGLWVDIDLKHASVDEAIRTVSNLPTPPTVTVLSGNGIHAYFKFSQPFRISNEQDAIKIKELSIRIHKYTNADHTSDLARVLRLPGSTNVKDLLQFKPCKITENTGAVYSLDDFNYLSVIEISETDKKLEKVIIDSFEAVDLENLKVPAHIKQLIVEGGKKGKRSEKVFWVTCSLLEHGHSPNEVAFILTNPDWGISEKILERPHQHQMSYIELAVNNARERITSGVSIKEILGVETTEIQEKNCCYYRGEQRLSNFIFEPSERIKLDGNEILKGEILISDGTKHHILLDYKSLITKKELLTAINSSKVSWLGGDKEIQYLREFLLTKKVIEKIGVNKIGLHNKVFVTNDAIINHQGVVNSSEFVYVPKFTNSPMDLEKSITINMERNWHQLAKEVLQLLPKINQEDVIYTLIGWHFVVPIAPLIRKIADGGFPQLMIWGIKGVR